VDADRDTLTIEVLLAEAAAPTTFTADHHRLPADPVTLTIEEEEDRRVVAVTTTMTLAAVEEEAAVVDEVT